MCSGSGAPYKKTDAYIRVCSLDNVRKFISRTGVRRSFKWIAFAAKIDAEGLNAF